MSIKGAYVSSTQVASSTPFDNAGINFTSTDVQAALLEMRDHSVFDSETHVTASGTLTLTSTNKSLIFMTGSTAGQIIQMPDATTLFLSHEYQIVNQSNKTIQVDDGAGGSLFTLGQNSIGHLTLQLQGSSAGTWVWYQTTFNNAAGIINYNIISSSNFVTTSTTDVVITGFTVTPQAGTYAIWYSAENSCTGSGVDNVCTIYKGASAIADSLRHTSSTSGAHTFPMSTQTISQFDGATSCSVEVNTNGTLTVSQRSLILIRLGT
jgi:hypothetical protein